MVLAPKINKYDICIYILIRAASFFDLKFHNEDRISFLVLKWNAISKVL